MKLVKAITHITIETEVSIGGENVNDFLKEVCGLAHEALERLSIYRNDHNLPDDEFDGIEGKFCALLDKLGD